MPGDGEEVTLGDVTLRFIPQPHAYLLHELQSIYSEAFDESATTEQFFGALREGMYDALNAFSGGELKKRLPPWQYHGYPSREAWKAGEYDEESAKRTPTGPQITAAFDAGVMVNGDDFFSKLFTVVDPKVIKAILSDRLLTMHETISLNSQLTNGESPLNDSAGEPRTSPDDSFEETPDAGNGLTPRTLESPSLV